MFIYKITHSCKHQHKYSFEGTYSKYDWRFEYFSNIQCPGCCAKRNFDAGLPNLIGTKKQIAWAEQIRSICLSRLRLVALSTDLLSEEALAELQSAKGIRPNLREQTKATWWIDHRANMLKILPVAYAEISATE